MPSATTAESSDSMAPSMAMAKAGGRQLAQQGEGDGERLAVGRRQVPGQDRQGGQRGMPACRTPSTT